MATFEPYYSDPGTTRTSSPTTPWWQGGTASGSSGGGASYVPGGSAFYYGNNPEQQSWGQDETAAYKKFLSGGGVNWPTTWGASGSGSGGSGGGGGGAAPDYSAWGGWAAQARPDTLQYNELDLPEYQQVAPRAWDPSQFDTARQGVATGIADARNTGNMAFDRQLAEYQAMRNPYAQGPRTSNAGVDPRLLASMEAWGGAGSGGAAQAYGEGVQADQAMGSVYDLLASGQDQYQQGLIRSTTGDRMQMDQRLGGEQRMLDLGINMAQAKAKAAYDQEVWALGKEAADRNYEARMAEASANWDRRNTVDDTNVATGNAWNQNVMDTILSMIASGGTNIPQAGNSLSQFITMPRRS